MKKSYKRRVATIFLGLSIVSGAAIGRVEAVSEVGNVIGIGSTAKYWGANYSAAQIGGTAAIWAQTTPDPKNSVTIIQNAFYDYDSDVAEFDKWRTISTGRASLYQQFDGKHRFAITDFSAGAAGQAFGSWKYPMLIDSTGYVGIGTQTPTSPLTVKGKIHAEEIKVDLSIVSSSLTTDEMIVKNQGWADFVFSNDYKLMSLEDLEKSVKSEKHLPGIPTAEEVSKDGVNIGKMQAKLLQKIEELTLYLIEQNKKIDSQQQEIALLKKMKNSNGNSL